MVSVYATRAAVDIVAGFHGVRSSSVDGLSDATMINTRRGFSSAAKFEGIVSLHGLCRASELLLLKQRVGVATDRLYTTTV